MIDKCEASTSRKIASNWLKLIFCVAIVGAPALATVLTITSGSDLKLIPLWIGSIVVAFLMYMVYRGLESAPKLS